MSDINGVMKRGDVIWACPSCCDHLKTIIKKNKKNIGYPKREWQLWTKTEKKTIEAKITLSINNIVPKVVRECLENVHKGVSETVTQDVKQLWPETLYGSDFPELDESITTQRQAGRVAQKETTAKPPTIADAVKQAVVTQNEEERKRDEKRNNLIIYGVPEKVEKDYQTRIKNDNNKINELFTTINVNSKPKKIYRLGKFEAPNKGQTREPRALKVIISDPAEIWPLWKIVKTWREPQTI